METLEAIMTRRSIRRYKDKKISEGTINVLLKAAMNAPSAHNRQPWHFIIIDNHETMKKITEYHQYSKMLDHASHAIVVLGDTQIQPTDFWIHDCSAATENLLIAANALGLGAVWLGVHPSKKLIAETKKLLKIPENIIPLCIISLGYPETKKPPRSNYNCARVHRNEW